MTEHNKRRVLIRIQGLKSWHPALFEEGEAYHFGLYWLEEKDRARLPATRYINESDDGLFVRSWNVKEVRQFTGRVEF